MNGMILFLEILGTIAFSLSGAIEAMKKKDGYTGRYGAWCGNCCWWRYTKRYNNW